MRTAGGESLSHSLPPPSSGLLRLGTYVPLPPLRVLFLRNETRPGLGPRPRDEGSRLESRRNKSFGASTGGQRYVLHAASACELQSQRLQASGCDITADGNDDDSDRDSTLSLGGEVALELTLKLALRPKGSAGAKSPDGSEGFRMAIGREGEDEDGALSASRKSSGHLPLPRSIRSMRPVLSSVDAAGANSSDSSTTRNRSTGTVSLGLRSSGRTGPSRLRLRPDTIPSTWPFGHYCRICCWRRRHHRRRILTWTLSSRCPPCVSC
jgi:hypothetical protein